jgi:hypothetical protein
MRLAIAVFLVATLLNLWSAWRHETARRRAEEERERWARGVRLLFDAVRALSGAPVEEEVAGSGHDERGDERR